MDILLKSCVEIRMLNFRFLHTFPHHIECLDVKRRLSTGGVNTSACYSYLKIFVYVCLIIKLMLSKFKITVCSISPAALNALI